MMQWGQNWLFGQDGKIQSNAIILASLLESYYLHRFIFGFWESVWTASKHK
jgi:hypothetical protein